jgi:hypothetical protein
MSQMKDELRAGLTATRRSLHGVAELLMAGPQHRRSQTIRLRILPGGFSTIADPDVRVAGDTIEIGGALFPLTGTFGELGAKLGLDVGAPVGLYKDGSGLTAKDGITVDADAAATLYKCLQEGDMALRQFAPGAVPVLWPEHFDVGVTMDEVNYGVSLGDAFLDEPYAYVGPHTPRKGAFWNAPFGAVRALPGKTEEIVEFFAEGQSLVAEG